jgi:cytolysin-activating lysine-acyltransferase
MTQMQTLPDGTPRTIAEALGQITWLFSQSPLHKHLAIGDLEWSVMPPILHEQFRVFRFGPLPGLEHAKPEDFVAGMTKEGLEQMPLGERLDASDWKSGDKLWLLELITPFATPENKLGEAMLADLLQGPFAGKRFSLHRTDPVTGVKSKFTLGS